MVKLKKAKFIYAELARKKPAEPRLRKLTTREMLEIREKIDLVFD
ncbi:MAG: hypothetical protein MRECE_6c013 [Mycoplasmataceae bacterium CE_OT135]|nr:MAG: hypothetical protein MRECE_17c039 [Mycoplasmataceae bacterium CE_OT135]KLL03919.1 MAG: hypothetical protein MRECE_6c013 [Mycoplasmataceae bacterium CE_OT135]